MSSPELLVRRAETGDAEAIAGFNCAMAWETEEKKLAPDTAVAGARSLLQNPAFGFYLVAEHRTALNPPEVVASLLITVEWSDWRNGQFWWVQSVYVVPRFRRQGVYRTMYTHVKTLATDDPLVCGLRLYVEQENHPAQQAYRNLGMKPSGYVVFEELLDAPHDLPALKI